MNPDDAGADDMVEEIVRLRPDVSDAIEEIVARTGASRDAVINRLLASGIEQHRRAENTEKPS